MGKMLFVKAISVHHQKISEDLQLMHHQSFWGRGVELIDD